MASQSAEASGSPTTQKYVPRFKRDPTAVSSSIALYSHSDIAQKIGGDLNHTFCRAFVPPTQPLQPATRDIAATDTPVEPEVQGEQSVRPLSDEFCRIMIHRYAHLSPPRELWTRHNIAQLDANIGRPLPVFQEVTTNRFEFLGWFAITKWELCTGRSTAVQNFVKKRKVSQRDRTVEYWAKALGQDWARVQLERVREMSNDPMQAPPV
ncbi:hypothetical protein BC629DRAFT_1594425 [Irpex lacteus]|nr:hypothetical protein BC629DRAFT_1594425 [Irpex lacteus]